MKIRLILLLSLASLFASDATFGFSDKIILGPFSVSFEVNTTQNLTINTSEPLVQDAFNEYEFQISTAPFKRELIDVAIDDYKNSINVSESSLADSIINRVASRSYKATWSKAIIDGIPGMSAKIRSPGKSSFIAAYSPDQRNGTGKTIVLIESFATGDVTDSFLQNLKVSRAS